MITLPKLQSFSFLLEHPSGWNLLFDLSIRKDLENLAHVVVERLHRIEHRIEVNRENVVNKGLEEAGIALDQVESII